MSKVDVDDVQFASKRGSRLTRKQLQGTNLPLQKRLVELSRDHPWSYCIVFDPLLVDKIVDVASCELIQDAKGSSRTLSSRSMENGCFRECRIEAVAILWV